jgi:hypothetical protein
MAEFFKFIKQNRPDIGLVDNYDLSEIYDRDERFALSNLLLDPDGLDQIYGLSEDVSAEDIRTVGGLDKPVIYSLAISESTLNSVSFDLSKHITTDKAVGDPGRHSYDSNNQSDNIIVFHGGIAANKIEYQFLDEKGELKRTTVSTSRESLFSSEANNSGQYTSASFSGLFRIRRRSHVNEIRLSPNLLASKSNVITESPTHLLTIPVYMSTQLNSNPSVTNLECYVTKNSPLILPVRIGNSANVVITRDSATSDSPAFVYGWELKLYSDNSVIRSSSINSNGAVTEVSININVAGTAANNTDCLLYIYLDPSVVKTISLSGLGMQEIAGQDIGLIGFDSLEELNISNNRLSTVPVWIKTLDNKLKKLNIDGNPYWNDGIIQYFDWQSPPDGVTGASSSGDGDFTKTFMQVMSYSGNNNSGIINGYDGEYATVQDTSGNLYKNLRKDKTITVNAINGFRVFDSITELIIGYIRMVNPDFTKIFPKLSTLVANADGGRPAMMFGLIPKLNNAEQLMSISLPEQVSGGGSLRYMGDTITYTGALSSDQKKQFIGQFKITNFNIRLNYDGGSKWFGGICTTNDDITSGEVNSSQVDGLYKYSFVESGSASDAWAGWLENLGSYDGQSRDVAFRIASGENLEWKKLQNINLTWAGIPGSDNKIFYNNNVTGENAADILNAKSLTTINAWRSGWAGKIFSIKSAPELNYLQIGYNTWEGYSGTTGEQYILPSNFVEPISGNSSSKLRSLLLHSIIGASSKKLEFRSDDLQNLPKLSYLELRDSYFVGKFPTVYNTPNNLVSGVTLGIYFRNCRFRNLDAMGSSTNRIGVIWGPGNGTGVGGSLLPNFTISGSGNNNTLDYINLTSNLSSNYPSSWGVSSKRNRPIAALITGSTETTSVTEATWTSRNNNNTANAISDKLYQSASGSFSINTKVLVGDIVLNGGNELGVVTQIDSNNEFIYISDNVSISGATLSFKRAGQQIGKAYLDNYTNLSSVYLRGNRITGDLPSFVNCYDLVWMDFSYNLINNYSVGTLQNITGAATGRNSTPRLRSLNLRFNPLSVNAIQRIIEDAYAVATYYFNLNLTPNFTIYLFNTKYDSSTDSYINWTREEILNTSELEIIFNQLGSGNAYSGVNIQIFDN